MMGLDLNSLLQEQRFGEVLQHIEKHLQPLLNNDDITEREAQRTASCALRFMHSFMKSWEEIPTDAIADMLTAVSLCHRCAQQHMKESKEPLHLQKIFYHLLSKSLKRELLIESAKLSELLCASLLTVVTEDKSQVASLAFGAYAAMWNVALKCAKDNTNCDPTAVFQLRHAAIRLLLLSNKGIPIVQERLVVTHEIYQNEVFNRKNLSEIGFENISKLYTDVIDMLRNNGDTFTKDDWKSYMEIHGRCVQHLLSGNNVAAAKEACHALCSALSTMKEVTIPKLAGDLLLLAVLIKSDLRNQKDRTDKTKINKKSRTSMDTKQAFESVESVENLLININKTFASFQISMLSHVKLQMLASSGTLAVRQIDLDAASSVLSAQQTWFNDNTKEGIQTLCCHLLACMEAEENLVKINKSEDSRRVLWLHQEINKCVSVTLFINQATVQLASGLEEVRSNLTTTLEVIQQHRERLTTRVREKPSKSTAEDLIQLGSTSNKFGRWCSRKSEHVLACSFMSEMKSCFETAVKSALISPERLSQCHIWKKMEQYAECLRWRDQSVVAMDIVVTGLLWEPVEISAACDMWARIQVDLHKASSDDKPHPHQSLWSVLRKHASEDLSAAVVLKEEYEVYKNSRWGRAELKRHLVDELLSELTDKQDRAVYLVEKATLLWSLDHDNKRALHFCEEAIALFEEILAASSKKKTPENNVTMTRDHMARAYLWRHLVKDVDIDQVKSETLSEDPTNTANDPEDPSTYQDCFTVAMETLSDADLARQCWAEVIKVKGLSKVIACNNTTLQSLGVLASVYKLADKPFEELEVLQMMLTIAKTSQHDMFTLHAYLNLLDNHCRLRQPHLVTETLVAMDVWVETAKTRINSTSEWVWYLQAKAGALLFSGKVEEGMQCLKEACEQKEKFTQNKSRTKSVFMLDGNLKLYQARLQALLDSGEDTDSVAQPGENSTELQLAATRLLSGVFCYQFGQWAFNPSGKDKEDGNTGKAQMKGQLQTDRWGVLSQVLDCLLETGNILTNLGDYREAKCYLQQGLKIAQAFHIPRRFAKFHLALAHLDNLAGNYTNSVAHLNTAGYVLQAVGAAPGTEPDPADAEDNDEDESFIKGVKMTPDDDEAPSRSSVGGSPNAKRRRVKLPPHWSHPSTCDCMACCDVTLNGLLLRLMSAEAECLQFQHQASQADGFLNALLKNLESLTLKAQKQLQAVLQFSGSGGGVKLLPSFHQDVFTEVSIQLAESGLQHGDAQLYAEFSNKAIELLNIETYPWMRSHAPLLAYLYYLRAVPAVCWPAATNDPDVASVTTAVRKLNLSDSSDAKTPHHPVPSCNGRAPKKAVPKSSKQTSPDTDEILQPKVTGGKKEKNKSKDKRSSRKSSMENKADDAPIQKLDSVFETPERQQSADHHTPLADITDAVADAQQHPTIMCTPSGVSVGNKRTTKGKAFIDSDSDETDGRVKPKCPALLKKKRPKANLEKDSKSKLLKTALTKNMDKPENTTNQENVYEFVLSEDDKTPVKTKPKAQRGRKKAQTTRTRKGETEQSRDGDTADYTVICRLALPENDRPLSRNNSGSRIPCLQTNVSPIWKSPYDILSTDGARLDKRLSGQIPKVDDKTSAKKEYTPVSNVTVKQSAKARCESRIAKLNRTSKEPCSVARRSYENVSGTNSNRKSNETNVAAKPNRKSNETLPKPNIKSNETDKNVEKTNFVKRKSDERKVNNNKALVQVAAPQKKRLTRARTARTEANRFNSSIESDDMNISVTMPDEEDPEMLENSLTDLSNFDILQNSIDPMFRDRIGSGLSACGAAALEIVPEITLPSPEIPRKGSDNEEISENFDCHSMLNRSIEIPRADDDNMAKPKSKSKKGAFQIFEDAPEKPRLTKLKMKPKKATVNFAPKEEIMTSEKVSAYEDEREQESSIELLEKAFRMLKKHPAYLPYRQTCHALAMHHLGSHPSLPMNDLDKGATVKDKDLPWNVALYLAEAQAVTFRHQALRNINRRIRKLESSGNAGVNKLTDCMKRMSLDSGNLQNMHCQLTFNPGVSEVKVMAQQLPQDMVVCQLAVMEPPGKSRLLVACRYQADSEPLIVPLPGFSTHQGEKILPEFEAVQIANKESMASTDKALWWYQRDQQDENLKLLLERIEASWLGVWRGILHGVLEDTEDRKHLGQAATDLQQAILQVTGVSVHLLKLQVVLQATSSLRLEPLCTWLATELGDGGVTPDQLGSLAQQIIKRHEKLLLTLGYSRHLPVLLVLDKVIQQIPWESVPELRGRPVCRMPSLHFLHSYLQNGPGQDSSSPYNMGVDPSKTYYILDPESNLASTKEKFKKIFKERNWQGIIGRQPTTDEYAEALTKHDLFIYCGHGNGSKYLSGDSLQWLQSRAVALLMGCSSGKLSSQGRLESHGLILHYFLAGCPSMMGCLWDVTDKDIDRYLEELLQRWIGSQATESSGLLPRAAGDSREICKLPYLIGAAPVVYGLPVFAKR